jgi:hypothetical protein
MFSLENIAVELWRLRVLKEHELGVRLEESPNGEPYVPSAYVPAAEKWDGPWAGVSFRVSRPFSWEEVSRVRGALSFIITVVVISVVIWLIAAVVWLILRLIMPFLQPYLQLF